MNKATFILITALIFSNIKGHALDKKTNEPNYSFQENKGQIRDQFFNPRPDILFSGSTKGLAYHLRNNGISYQLNRVDSWKEEVDHLQKELNIKGIGGKIPDQTTIYRLDVDWLNCNTNPFVNKGEAQPGYNNYYLPSCPYGVMNVKNYSYIIYKNIYSGIDLKWYEKEGRLKYDYLVSAGANYKNIQLEFKGATKISLNTKGELVLTTPLGTIIEQAPLVIQNGKTLTSKWVFKQNIVRFDINNIDPDLPFVIDPALRIWGTYCGGGDSDIGTSCTTDASGNVYMTGYTVSNTGTLIATTGSHQSTHGGSTYDAFLVKFNSAGIRQWGTYYGGTGMDYGYSCAIDVSGNVYMAGNTGSNAGAAIATIGSHQSIHGGGASDAFLVKFNNAGARQWGTYYGGTGAQDYGYSCSTDPSGNVYLTGITNSNNGNSIATAGGHQITYGGGTRDAFLVKFNSVGVRQWGTYYGGTGATEYGNSCTTDASGNVYLAGVTDSNTGTVIATTGSHQVTFGGIIDAFFVKFSSTGVRQWGTYYGGTGADEGRSCVTDALGNVYFAGDTESTTSNVIATTGSHQSSFGGLFDAFLVQFNITGARQWGTYYGGTGTESGYSCAADASGNVYLSGQTTSNTGTIIATTGSHQGAFGGGVYDAFLARFNNAGTRQSATYYGDIVYDGGYSCAADASGNVYLAGYTSPPTSGTVIATIGSHQSVYGGGGEDAFLVKFSGCNSAPNQPPAISGNISICSGSSNTYSIAAVSGATSYTWSLSGGWAGTSTTNIITTTSNANSGIVSVIANNGCGSSPSQTLSVTVNTTPSTPAAISGSISLCSNTGPSNYSIVTVAGATSYTWFLPGGWSGASSTNIISATPGSTGIFTVTASNSCGTSPQQTLNVTVDPLPIITVNSGSVCSGQSFTITPGGASTYTFQGGNSVVFPTSTTSYTVVGTSAAGCSSSSFATSNVTVNALPSISVNSGSICNGQNFTITPNGANTYTFSNGPVVSPTTTSSYSITGTSTAGCVSPSAAISSVTVNVLPTINASTTNSILCVGQSATLTASGALSYTWNPGGIGPNITVSPTITANYTITGTNVFSCANSLVFTQNVSPCTGINQFINPSSELNIYPNPFNNKIVIASNSINQKIQIFNALGYLVYCALIENEKTEVDLAHNPSGIYFIQIGTITKKMIKE
ncbi:MAG: SBBP repeat-containing protein [Bacteroidetes bacterium]|nr:SBBP repeat-containing protein [Bacteroidota bacterium]